MSKHCRDSSEIPAIDTHAHYGPYYREENPPTINTLMSGDPGTVVRRARLANTQTTVVSALACLMPRGGADAVRGNEAALTDLADHRELLYWVVVHPGQPATFDQARRALADRRCAGIKIHPEEHCYHIAERGDRLFTFAAEHRAVILTHSGDVNSLPADFIPFADAFPEVDLVLAHLGNGGEASGSLELQMRAIEASKNGNVYTDTSSARSIQAGLIEWAVKRVGHERILYGTDSPCYFAPSQRARIHAADISDEAKAHILRENAVRLLQLEEYDFDGKPYLQAARTV